MYCVQWLIVYSVYVSWLIVYFVCVCVHTHSFGELVLSFHCGFQGSNSGQTSATSTFTEPSHWPWHGFVIPEAEARIRCCHLSFFMARRSAGEPSTVCN